MIEAQSASVRRRVAALVGSVLVAYCLTADVAHASIAADFNGDGVLDAVVLPHPPETNIVIRMSGSAPQILKLSSRVISIVAADVDHDGNLDLSALSERHGLHVWLNKAGHGRFAALKKHRAPRGFGISPPSQTSATQRGDNAPASSDQSTPDADTPRAGPVFDATPSDCTAPSHPSASSADLASSTAPRGPPRPPLH